jgi:NitT/TauT family transport system substrate-binding protein
MTLLAFSYHPGAAQPRRKIAVAFVAPSVSQAIPWIAKEAGILSKHGLDADVILLTGSPRLVQTLVAGDLDYAIAGVASVLRARMRGADTAILATGSNYSSQRVLVRPQSPFHRLQDLKGRIVGVTQYGSEGDTFLRAALRIVGLRPDADVTILQMGGTPQVGAAVIAGKVDAGVTGESGLILIHQGRVVQLPGASALELKILGPGATLTATRRNIGRDRDGVMQFMRAYVETVHYFKTNREGSVRALQKYLRGATPEQIAVLYEEQRDIAEPLPLPSEEAIQAVLDRESDPKAKTFKPADFLDVSFLREIERSGFLAELYSKGSSPR